MVILVFGAVMHNTDSQFGSVAKCFHWSIVLLLLCSYTFEQFMHGLPDGALKWQFYDLHKSTGITILFVTFARLVWRSFNPAPALPMAMPTSQKKTAKVSHIMLYACVLIMPVSGFIGSKAGGFNAFWFGVFEMPDLFGKNEQINFWAELIHMVTAYTLLATIMVHVLAALYHQYFLRDGLMMRMLPWGRKGQGWHI